MIRLIIAMMIALAMSATSNSNNNVSTYSVDPNDTTTFTGGENGHNPPPRP